MKNYTLRTIAITAIFGTATSAQERGDIIMVRSVQAAPAPPPVMWEQPFGLIAVEPLEMGEPIQNAPYSAEIVTEVIQELADGNRIERRTTAMVARDGQGRVRREQELAAIGPVLPRGNMRIITINDPVARMHYSLDPARKAATRTRPAGHPHPGAHLPPPPPVHSTGGANTIAFEHHVEAPSANRVLTEKLGTKEFEGVTAEGTRTTMTIPPGEIGNVRAIEIVSERWYSRELQVVVFSRRSDPRFGETIYRVTNIVRAEPDPSLFLVPPDYKTEEMKLPPFENLKRKLSIKPPPE